jgi:hypothetical protein
VRRERREAGYYSTTNTTTDGYYLGIELGGGCVPAATAGQYCCRLDSAAASLHEMYLGVPQTGRYAALGDAGNVFVLSYGPNRSSLGTYTPMFSNQLGWKTLGGAAALGLAPGENAFYDGTDWYPPSCPGMSFATADITNIGFNSELEIWE